MKTRNIRLSYMLIITLLSSTATLAAQTLTSIKSPDKRLSAEVCIIKDRATIRVFGDEQKSLIAMPVGLIADSTDLGLNVRLERNAKIQRINETYRIVGNHPVAINKANEVALSLIASGKKYTLFIRVYNDGVAFRYSIPNDIKRIDGEATAWVFQQNVEKIAWYDDYEGYSHAGTINDVPLKKAFVLPMTVKAGGYYVSISEADNQNYCDLLTVRTETGFKAVFPNAAKGWSIPVLKENNPNTPTGKYKGLSVSPWRTLIIARDLSGLVNSDMLTSLCPAPAKGVDFSYALPGRCLWQWWGIGAPRLDDQKNWYDAAVKLKWEYYLIDDGWRNWKQGDKDQWTLLKEAIDYGKSVGVKTIVWADSKEFRNAADRMAYLKKVVAVGAVGIKIDFIPAPTPDIMQWYTGTMQDCADLKLLLNFHGSVKPTGLRRTYPNDITREAVRGNEFQMTRYRRVIPYDQDVTLPFTRFMAGPADFTPVIFNPKELSSKNYTWAHELAQAIVYLSPITHFCDQYSFYVNSPLLDLLQELPTTWDETRVLPCTEMGEVVAFARRKGKTWWVGVMNGGEAKELKISLDFLGKNAKATLVYDAETNAAVNRKEQTISSKESLSLSLNPGGGFVGRFSLK